MKKRLIELLKTSDSIQVLFKKNGILFFDGNAAGGPGYLLKKNGSVIMLPMNAMTLSMK